MYVESDRELLVDGHLEQPEPPATEVKKPSSAAAQDLGIGGGGRFVGSVVRRVARARTSTARRVRVGVAMDVAQHCLDANLLGEVRQEEHQRRAR